MLMLMTVLPLILSGAPVDSQAQMVIANQEVAPTRIDWLPQVEYEELVLSIVGPADLYIRKEFGLGQMPYLSIADSSGERLPDGSYTYELRVIPGQGREAQDGTSARETGNNSATPKLRAAGSPAGRPLLQEGSFSIRDGVFVSQQSIGTTPNHPKVPLRPISADQTIGEDLIVQGTLELQSTTPNIFFTDTNSIDWAIEINPVSIGSDRFYVRDLSAPSIPFALSGGAPDYSIFVKNDGNVGMGTATPAAALHVVKSTGALATLARFSNNLGIQVLYDRTDAGANDWQTSNFSSAFEISIPGSSPAQFSLASNGNLAISGTLNQGSSRDLKTDIASLDPAEVLSQVTSLPVSAWSYKTEIGVRHVSPMAEDFHRTFGMGADDKHLAPGDQAGIALLAIQGLNQVVREKDKEIAELKSRMEALERLVQSLAQEKTASESEQ
jgi:hypothetical protein